MSHPFRHICFLVISVFAFSGWGFAQQNEYLKAGFSFEKKIKLIASAKHGEHKKYRHEIQPFVDSVIMHCEKVAPAHCTRAKVIRSKYYFEDRDFKNFIPIAVNEIENDPLLTLQDSMLYYNRLSKAFEHSNVYVESLKYRTKLQKLLPRYLKEFPLDIMYITNMSDFYAIQGKYRQALAAYKNNLKTVQERKNFFHVGTLTNSVGVCFNKVGEADSAIKYFNKARQLYFKYNNYDSSYINGLIDGNIAQAYMTKREYHKAIPLLENDINGSRLKDRANAVNSYVEIIRCFLQLKEYDRAYAALQELEKLTLEVNLNSGQRLNYLMLNAKVYSALSQYQRAQEYLYKYIQLNKEVNTAAEIRQTNALLMVYDLDEKKKIIASQKQKFNQVKQEMDSKKMQQFLIWGIMLVVAVILIIVLLANKKVNEQKEALEEQVEITNDALLQKDVLLKEIHHRVKNNLQIMSGLMHLQAANSDHECMKKHMKEGQQRIESMTLIHNMLYQTDQQLSQVNIGAYLNELIEQLRLSFDIPSSIYIVNDIEELHVSLDIAVPMGLIVNELITNSVKYAFPNGEGKISITMRATEYKKGYSIEYMDNGIGFDPNVVMHGSSLGVKLINMFCEEMDAKLAVTSISGVHYTFTFV